jgi:ArsR family transcriptional regulator, arsenate/arsenite/antimonite-responsive transcriptional repressor
MAKAKLENFSTDELLLADVAKAISHPARIKILKILSEYNACFCGEIVDLLPLSQATVSQHLNELKRVGLIKGEIEGPKTCYCINDDLLERATKQLTKFLNNVCKC